MKHQAVDGQDQCEGAMLEARAGVATTPGWRGTPVTIDESERCFNSLATAATTGKTTLDQLVKTNSTLTSSIEELDVPNTQPTKEVASFLHEANKYKKGGQEINGRIGNPEKYFPNYKRDTWYDPYDLS